MNVKFVFERGITAWDTRADGSASLSQAALQIDGLDLVVWTDLTFDGFTSVGQGRDGEDLEVPVRHEKGRKEVIARLSKRWSGNPPTDLYGYAEALGLEQGLLRLDVDGETIWQAAPPEDDEGYDDEPGGEHWA